jgi:hypothetical protein
VGFFVVGGVLFLGGITLLGFGSYRHVRWRDWKSRQQVFAPHVGRTALGTWTPGLSLRF